MSDTPEPTKPKDESENGPPPMAPRSRMPMILIIMLGATLLFSAPWGGNGRKNVDINEFHKLVDAGSVASLTISGNHISGELKDGESFSLLYPAMDSDLIAELREKLPDATITAERPSLWAQLLIGLIPWILIFGLIWFFLLRSAAGGGGLMGKFSRSRHTVVLPGETMVTFKDVAGIPEAKEEVAEIIEYLKSPKSFGRLGGRVPRGLVMIGVPGCGKTLLAKAMAGEARVPFLSVTGSDFVEMFVGVGASRVRDLFTEARRNQPCIVFIDEIDAVGRRRGANFGGGGHDEREQTLNAILVEMDGFKTADQVIVVAATNRADILDPALLRPGRFDRQVHVPLPDMEGRYEILKVHAGTVRLGVDIDLRKIARGTPMFSGADLRAVVNEAALVATMRGKDWVEQDDFDEARDKVKWGKARKSRLGSDEERKLTAYHEAGHAIVQALEKHADPIHKVSIIPRGPYGGATFSLPERDRTYFTKKYVLATLRSMMGGRAAEELFLDDISSGATSDIRQATELARQMVEEWGMDDEVGLVYHHEDAPLLPKRISDNTASMIESRIKSLISDAHNDAAKTIKKHRDKCDAVAKALLQRETISGADVQAIIDGHPPEWKPRPTTEPDMVAELLSDKFRMLAKRWKADTKLSSKCGHEHEAYRKIIEMGDIVIPHLLAGLDQDQPEHWFLALAEITGENPVLEEHRGDICKMAKDWLKWADDHGIAWSGRGKDA